MRGSRPGILLKARNIAKSRIPTGAVDGDCLGCESPFWKEAVSFRGELCYFARTHAQISSVDMFTKELSLPLCQSSDGVPTPPLPLHLLSFEQAVKLYLLL